MPDKWRSKDELRQIYRRSEEIADRMRREGMPTGRSVQEAKNKYDNQRFADMQRRQGRR